VVSTQDLCRQWNSARPIDQRYTPETSDFTSLIKYINLIIPPFSLENLFLRFEEPSSMVRWDSPLLTVLWSDNVIPSDELWQAVTSGTVKPPNVGTQSVFYPSNQYFSLLTLIQRQDGQTPIRRTSHTRKNSHFNCFRHHSQSICIPRSWRNYQTFGFYIP
jgi:Chromatin associated protein KTI12